MVMGFIYFCYYIFNKIAYENPEVYNNSIGFCVNKYDFVS